MKPELPFLPGYRREKILQKNHRKKQTLVLSQGIITEKTGQKENFEFSEELLSKTY